MDFKNCTHKPYHVSVMLTETIDALLVKSGGLYLDGTLGGGGHSLEILKRGGNVVAFDRDAEAIAHCTLKFAEFPAYKNRYTLVRQNFFKTSQFIRGNLPHIDCIDGAVLDLGVSSHQIDETSRGFSYLGDAAIDMRMNNQEGLSAYDVVNSYPAKDLLRILYAYGEEKNAKKIVKAIEAARAIQPIETTKELSALVCGCFSPFVKGGHPAKRTFQALRIEVNQELEGLSKAIQDIITLLKPGARLSVISFHSLEDRIVKQTFKKLSENCICDKSLPVCVCLNRAVVKRIGKGDKPKAAEISQNSRSKSATLRVAEKL